MADKNLPSAANAESIEEALRRLSKKSGVKAWLMLDRSTGAVLKTNGHVASVRPARSSSNNNNDENENENGDNSGSSNSNSNNSNNNNNSNTSAGSGGGGGGGGGGGVNNNNNNNASSGNNSFSTDVNANSNNETQAAQELAAMVWSFLGTAGGLVGEMDSEDELKLLRLRTKKQEIVIVPEHKYLMVVIHDTPPV